MSDKNTCKNCKFWQEWKDRVEAKLSRMNHPNMANGLYELRRCRWEAHPSVDILRRYIYTDEFYHCNEWTKCEK